MDNVTIELKTYVEFFMPGIMFPNTTIREVKDRNANALLVPPGVYKFVYFDMREITYLGDVYTSDKRLNVSGNYYIGGTVHTLDDIPNTEQYRILLDNMRCNHWDRMIECSTGNWQPFNAGDIVIGVE